MAATLYARTYQTVAVEATDSRQALLLLFEGAVRYLHQAREAMSRGDYEGQGRGITRTQRILSTLMTSLDHTQAPELAESLATTYAWMHSRLTEANLLDDLNLLDQVIASLTELHAAWVQAWHNLAEQEQGGSQPRAA